MATGADSPSLAGREQLRISGLALVLALGLTLAWRARFVLDDAFISFHYARSWVEGNGLTWFGEPVEGYTNFGWVVWLALGFLMGIEPVAWAHTGGLAALVAALYLTWRIAEQSAATNEQRTSVALVASLVLATNYSFHAFATSGLETMTQTALVLGAFLCAQKSWADVRAHTGTSQSALGLAPFIGVSVCSGLALLVRLDSAVLLAPIAIWSGAAALRSGSQRVRCCAALVLPVLLLVAPWLIWKLDYYGRLLPNSFYAKVPTDGLSLDGALQWGRFVSWYGLAPVIAVLAAVTAWRGARPKNLAVIAVAAAVITLHAIYLVRVGGDFMEFRFLVPVAPYFALLVAILFEASVAGVAIPERRMLGAMTVGILALCSLSHAHTFWTDPELRMDGVPQLGTFYGLYPDGDWQRVGAALAREFGRTEAVIATTAAGAVPYYSRLPTIDLFGLNDRTIPQLGIQSAYRRPGHRSQASFEYLRERGVNLIVAKPVVVTAKQLQQANSESQLRIWAQVAVSPTGGAPSQIEVVAMPLAPVSGDELPGSTDAEPYLLLWYFEPSPELDRIIRNWQRWSVPFAVADAPVAPR